MKCINARDGLAASPNPWLTVVTTAVVALSLAAHVSCFSQPATDSRRSARTTGAAADGKENDTNANDRYAHLRPGSRIRHHSHRYNTMPNYCVRNATPDRAPRPRFLLGALLPLTAPSDGAKHDSRTCTEPRSVFIVQFVEALKLAVDEALNSSDVARELISGVEIHDSCGIQDAAAEQALALATRSFAAHQRCAGRGEGASDGYGGTGDEVLAGVIGPGLSGELETASPILNSYQVPHISYWSTSDLFTTKTQYPYLVRTTSADSNQAYAIHEILRYFGWSYVNMLSEHNPSGRTTLADRVRLLATQPPYSVCFAQDATYRTTGEVSGGLMVGDLVWEWYASKQRSGRYGGGSSLQAPSVVLMLVGAPHAKVVFDALEAKARMHEAFAAWLAREHFVWLANDSWISEAADVVHYTKRKVAMGFHTVIGTTLNIPNTPLTVESDSFQDRLLLRLKSSYQRPETFENNPWLALAWQKRFSCRLPFVICDPREECYNRSVCNVNMSVADAFSTRREHFSSPVSAGSLWLAAKTFVWKLEAVYRAVVNSSSPSTIVDNIAAGLKPDSACGTPGYEMKGCSLFDNVTHDLHPSFRIQAVMYDASSGQWTLQDLFQWAKSSGSAFFSPAGVDLYKRKFHKTLWADGRKQAPSSVCSARCANGSLQEELKERIKGDIQRPAKCCWRCTQCASNEYHDTQLNICRQCDAGQLAVDSNTHCENAPDYYVGFGSKTGVGLLGISAAAIVVMIATAVVYYRHRDHEVVRAAYMESSMVLLVCGSTCLASNFLYFMPPLAGLCVVRKIVVSVNISVSVSTLISRALRHIFLSDGNSVHRFVRKAAAVLVPTVRRQLLVLVLAHVAVVPLIVLFGTYVATTTSEFLVSKLRRDIFCLNSGDENGYTIVVMVCVLLTLCYVAFSARKVVVTSLLVLSRLPNEAQLMAFAACLLAIIWFSLLPIAFTSSGVLAPVVTGIALVLHQAAIWCFLFVPRLWVLFKGGSLKSQTKIHRQAVRQASHDLSRAQNSLTRTYTNMTFSEASVLETRRVSNSRSAMTSPVAGNFKNIRSCSLPVAPQIRETTFVTSASIASVTSVEVRPPLHVKDRGPSTANSHRQLNVTGSSCYAYLIESSL